MDSKADFKLFPWARFCFSYILFSIDSSLEHLLGLRAYLGQAGHLDIREAGMLKNL